MVLLTTCPEDVSFDTSVPLMGSPMIVSFVEEIVTVVSSGLDDAGTSELSNCELTCSYIQQGQCRACPW